MQTKLAFMDKVQLYRDMRKVEHQKIGIHWEEVQWFPEYLEP